MLTLVDFTRVETTTGMAKALTQLHAKSKMLCLVTPGRMMPSKGGVASSFSVMYKRNKKQNKQQQQKIKIKILTVI